MKYVWQKQGCQFGLLSVQDLRYKLVAISAGARKFHVIDSADILSMSYIHIPYLPHQYHG